MMTGAAKFPCNFYCSFDKGLLQVACCNLLLASFNFQLLSYSCEKGFSYNAVHLMLPLLLSSNCNCVTSDDVAGVNLA